MSEVAKPEQPPFNLRTEFIAGVTTFLTVVYIVVVNPSVLYADGKTGITFSGALTATVMAAPPGRCARLDRNVRRWTSPRWSAACVRVSLSECRPPPAQAPVPHPLHQPLRQNLTQSYLRRRNHPHPSRPLLLPRPKTRRNFFILRWSICTTRSGWLICAPPSTGPSPCWRPAVCCS